MMSELSWYFCQKKALEVHLVLYGKTPALFYPIPRHITVHKPGTNFKNRLRFFYTIGRLIYLRHTIKKINPDSILSFGEYWNNMVLLSLVGLRYPVYISDRSQPGKNLGIFNNLLRSVLYRGAAGYIAQTRVAAHVAGEWKWNRNIKVIGNPIRQLMLFNHFEKEKIILSVGRLIATKHFDKLIELFAQINIPEWKLVIVGGDAKKQDNYSELSRLVKSLKVEEKVFLEGTQTDVDCYYLKSMIFAFTSSSEGFPNVIGEALSAGLPVVAFDCIAGPSDLISDGLNGYLVPLFDVELFRQRLSLLMHNEELRNKMAANAIKSVKGFSISLIGESFYDFII